MGVFISVGLFCQNFHVTLWDSDLFLSTVPFKKQYKEIESIDCLFGKCVLSNRYVISHYSKIKKNEPMQSS